MTERLRKILRGSKLTPVTADEQAVKIAVDNAGGGYTYGTVAEIQVGEMEGQEGQYSYEAVAENVPEISESETYYLNDESNPSTMVQVEGGSPLVGFNVQFDGEVPSRVNPDEPLVMVAWEDEIGRVLVQSDTTDLSNTTVKILKKVSGGGSISVDSELSDTSENPVQNKVITAALEAAKPLIVHGTVDGVNSTAEITDEISLGEIYTAAAAGRFVAFECSLDEGNATRLALASRTLVAGEYSFSFTTSATQSDKPAVISVEFKNSKTGTFEMAVAQ